MAELDGNLWELNFAKLVVLDVSSDYELMRDPMPAVCYPVLAEKWVMRSQLPTILPNKVFAPGYLYDWHESCGPDHSAWYVGVVRSELADALINQYES
ncbi:MAG: hypothetical protein J0L72_05385 [Armatimonadetes bacterium]|nr:hypothetical protein [Armatimonadota bacterium]